MPKPNYQYTHFAISKLLDDVKSKSCIDIKGIGDCKRLSETIGKAGFLLSKDTLARLYKVISSKSMPSKYTLDLLADYVGENSWDCFFTNLSVNIEGEKSKSVVSEDVSESELMLIRYCIHDKAFNPISNYLYENADILRDPNSDKSSAVFKLIDENIRENVSVRYKLLEIIINHEILRERYFNYYVNIDGLNTYYANYIENKFIKKLNPIQPDFRRNYIWAQSILITSYLYANKTRKLLKSGYELFNRFKPENEKLVNFIIDGEIHYYPYARFHFAHIIYVYYSEKDKAILGNIVQSIYNDIQLLNDSAKAVVLAQIFESLSVAKKPELILAFSDVFKTIIKNLVDFTSTKNEPESLVQMSFYFYNACNLQDRTNLADHFVKPEAFNNQNYKTTYAYYYDMLKMLTLENSGIKQTVLQNAYKAACKMNNHFFINRLKT
jgi:hypothetical protein